MIDASSSGDGAIRFIIHEKTLFPLLGHAARSRMLLPPRSTHAFRATWRDEPAAAPARAGRPRRGFRRSSSGVVSRVSSAGLDEGHVRGREGGGELAVHLLVRVDAARLELARDAALRARGADAGAHAVAARVLLGDAELRLERRLLGPDAAQAGDGGADEADAGEEGVARTRGAEGCARSVARRGGTASREGGIESNRARSGGRSGRASGRARDANGRAPGNGARRGRARRERGVARDRAANARARGSIRAASRFRVDRPENGNCAREGGTHECRR